MNPTPHYVCHLCGAHSERVDAWRKDATITHVSENYAEMSNCGHRIEDPAFSREPGFSSVILVHPNTFRHRFMTGVSTPDQSDTAFFVPYCCKVCGEWSRSVNVETYPDQEFMTMAKPYAQPGFLAWGKRYTLECGHRADDVDLEVTVQPVARLVETARMTP